MKIVVDKFVYEPPGLSVVPETEYEAALLSRYWKSAELSIGRASAVDESADGHCYSVRFSFDRHPAVPADAKEAALNESH